MQTILGFATATGLASISTIATLATLANPVAGLLGVGLLVAGGLSALSQRK